MTYEKGWRSVEQMRRGATAALVLGVLASLALAPMAGAQTTIDSFTTPQPVVNDPPGGMTTGTTAGSDILGLQRDMTARMISGPGNVTGQLGGQWLEFLVSNTTPDSQGRVIVTWDGVSTTFDPAGLGAVNLTAGGSNALRLRVLSATAGTSVKVEVFTNGANHSWRALVLPAVLSQTDFYLGFTSFSVSGGAGADFANVGAIQLTVSATEANATIDDLSTVVASSAMTGTLTDNVAVPAIPGQTLDYTATIANTGVGDATNVQLLANLPSSVSLNPASIEVSPLARDDGYTVAHDGLLMVPASTGLLANDVDAEPSPDPLVVSPVGILSSARFGTVVLMIDGSFNYSPPPGFLGADSFNYAADDGNGIPGPATVTIDVVCPVITVNPSALADGLYNAAYPLVAFSASGAPTAVTFSATGLPSFMALGLLGDLQGTPTDTGNYTLVVTATDTAGCQGSRTIPWTVRPNPDPESYTGGVGNTQFVVNVSGPSTPHVLVNDSVLNGDQGPGALSASPAVIATANGGSVAMASNGTFTYTPPVNYPGPSDFPDSFIYTLTDGNLMTNTATVTIELSNRVWYVNNTTGSDSNSGRSHQPFATIGAAGSAATSVLPGDTIFVHSSATPYAGASLGDVGLTLWGQGTAFSLNSLSIAAGARPTINSTLAVAASDVTIHSFNISVTGATQGLAATGQTGLAVNNLAVTSQNGNGVTLSNTSASFANNLTIAVTGSGMGFSATGGGAITVAQDNVTTVNTISTATGTALNVVNAPIGPSGLTFRSLSSSGAANGIVLSNTGSSGGLTVTGTGSAASGGTIQNAAQNGVQLSGAQNVSLSFMTFNTVATSDGSPCSSTDVSGCRAAVKMSSVSDVLLDDLSITNSGQEGVSGAGVTRLRVTDSSFTNVGNTVDEAAIHVLGLFDSAAGQNLIEDVTMNNVETGIRVRNSNGLLNDLTIRNVTTNDVNEDSVSLLAEATAVATFLVDNLDALGPANNDGVDLSVEDGATGNITVQNSTFQNSGFGFNGVILQSNDSALGTWKVLGNAFFNNGGSSIIAASFVSAAATVVVANNDVDCPGGGTCQAGEAVRLIQDGNGTLRAFVDDNQITRPAVGVLARARNGTSNTGRLDVRLRNNSVSNVVSPLFQEGIFLEAGTSSGTHLNTLCVNIGLGNSPAAGGNSSVGAGSPTPADGYRISERTGATVLVQGIANGSSQTVVDAFVVANNTGTSSTRTGTYDGGTCTTPIP